MTEDKKDTKDKKKLTYEQPRLVDLGGFAGCGATFVCTNGSGEQVCDDGNAAQFDCDVGAGVDEP